MKKILLALLLLTVPAHAQLTGNPVKDIQTALKKPPGQSPTLFPEKGTTSDFLTSIANLVDTADASTEAMSIQGLQDPVGASCWQSFGGISAVVKAHPLPLTGKLAVDYEAARLLHIGLVQVCANPNCGQMWQDLENIVNAINPMTLNMSLTSICSKIPVAGTTAAQYTVPNFTPVPAAPAAAPTAK